MSNDDIVRHHDNYPDSMEMISEVVQNRNITYRRHNNAYVDKLMQVSSSIFMKFLIGNEDTNNNNGGTNKNNSLTCELSPRRKSVRDEVSTNLVLNGEKMKVKYGKRKRLIVKEFIVGDSVAIKVPPNDRGKCDMNRIPALVKSISGKGQQTYKLVCAYGVIEGRFTASSLVEYPGQISVDDSKIITLREAARMFTVHKSDITFGKCKVGCKTKKCPCKKKGVKCMSRCHKGHTCSNCETGYQSSQNKTLVLPSWGGKYKANDVSVCFSNTCTVDNWLVLVKIISFLYPSDFKTILDDYFSKNSDFVAVLGLIQKSYYDAAKYRLAKLNDLSLRHNSIDFYGDEYNLFVKHMTLFTEHNLSSKRSSKYCPLRERNEIVNSIPATNATDQTGFIDDITKWLFGSWTSKCKLPLSQPLPAKEHLTWDYNNEM